MCKLHLSWGCKNESVNNKAQKKKEELHERGYLGQTQNALKIAVASEGMTIIKCLHGKVRLCIGIISLCRQADIQQILEQSY